MKPIDINGVAVLCLVSDRTAEKYVIDPTFPPAMRPGGRSRIWDEAEVIAWIRAQRDDKDLIDDLAGQYAEQDGSEQYESSIIEFITSGDLHQIDEILSGQIGIHDADTDWLEQLLDKVKTLGTVQSDTHVFGVTRAYKVAAQ